MEAPETAAHMAETSDMGDTYAVGETATSMMGDIYAAVSETVTSKMGGTYAAAGTHAVMGDGPLGGHGYFRGQTSGTKKTRMNMLDAKR